MSADNYIVICRKGTGYANVMPFASDREYADEELDDGPASNGAPTFATLNEAIRDAQSEYTEYGYRITNKALKA